MTGYELLWLIYLYSFFGWCLEVCLAALRRKTFVNRGILNAPFCMLYVLIVFMLYNMLLSGMALARYTQRQAGEEPAGALWQKTAESLDEHFPDERIEKIYPNLVIVD